MQLKWTDTQEIAMALFDTYPNEKPQQINFVELRDKVIQLEGFADNPAHSGERVLEAIQLAWIEEQDD